VQQLSIHLSSEFSVPKNSALVDSGVSGGKRGHMARQSAENEKNTGAPKG